MPLTVNAGGLLGGGGGRETPGPAREALGPDGRVEERGGTWFHTLPGGRGSLPEAERRAAFLRAKARYLAGLSPARRAALGSPPAAAGRRATPPAGVAVHPVLYGVCAVTGMPSLTTDPTTAYLSRYRIMFARGAFGPAPGDGKLKAAWLATPGGGWRSVGVPRFTADGSFLRFELGCVTPAAKALAAHVRGGGFLSAEADVVPTAEHTDRLTRVVTRADVCGVLLTPGAGVPALFPCCSDVHVR